MILVYNPRQCRTSRRERVGRYPTRTQKPGARLSVAVDADDNLEWAQREIKGDIPRSPYNLHRKSGLASLISPPNLLYFGKQSLIR
eukprot:1645375-Rhodomonas_salina.2